VIRVVFYPFVLMKVFVWNVRGAKKSSFFSTYSRFLQLYHPQLCILLETRLFGLSLDRMRCRICGFYSVPSQGLAGGY